MADYILKTMDEKRRRGRPSAFYRTILVEFLASPDSRARVIATGKNDLAVTEGLRIAKRNSVLFDPITVGRVGSDIVLSKAADYWESIRRKR